MVKVPLLRKVRKCVHKNCLTLSVIRDETNFCNIWFSHTRLGYGDRSRVCHCGHGSGCWGWHHKGGHDALIDYYIYIGQKATFTSAFWQSSYEINMVKMTTKYVASTNLLVTIFHKFYKIPFTEWIWAIFLQFHKRKSFLSMMFWDLFLSHLV